MSDPTVPKREGTGRIPEIAPFEPVASAIPDELRDPIPSGTSIIVLLDASEDPRWAADAAIELSRSWASRGRRIVLADLHIDEPVLHERAGIPNLEGVVDIFLYGASLARSARPVKNAGFYLISAGTYTPDAGAVFAHPRWAKLIAGFRDANASLVLFVAEGAADFEALGSWTDEVIVLGGSGATDTVERLGQHGLRARAVLVPPGTRVQQSPPAEPSGSGAGPRRAGISGAEDPAPSVESGGGRDGVGAESIGGEHPAPPAESSWGLEPPGVAHGRAEDEASPAPDFAGSDSPTAAGRGPDRPEADAEVADSPAGAGSDADWPAPDCGWAAAEPLSVDASAADEDLDPWKLADEPARVEPTEPSPDAAPPTSAPPAAPESETRVVGVVAPRDDELDREIELPPPPVRRRPPRRSGLMAVLWLLLAIALLAAAGFAASRLRPDLFPWLSAPQSLNTAPADAGEEVAAAPSPPAATAQGETLPYSVQVKAFTSFTAASDQITAERRRFADAPLYISPEEIQGVLYYRILAGAAPDTVSAVRVRQRLVEAGSVDPEDAAGTWSLIQYTPLTFALGEFENAGEAAAVSDSLRNRQVPSYVVQLPYSDGSSRWRLYGGAFRDSVAAEKMRQLLEAAGIEPRLVEREGAPAQVRT